MKKVKCILIFALVLLALVCFAACEKTYCEVIFDTDGGSAIALQSVEKGSAATKPAESPTKTGFVFDGWYKDAELTVPFDWESPVYENTTVYAKFSPAALKRTVTFEGNGGSPTVSQTVNDGGKAVLPEPPSKTGYAFKGWFLDNGTFSNGFDFETAITSDVTLYAKWTRVFVVTFHNENGNAISSQTVEGGQTAAEPTDVFYNGTEENWMLEGWCTEEELETAFDFSTPINSDIELWANWVRAFEVAFENNGGAVIASQTVTEGGKAVLPEQPSRQGYVFKGWFLDNGTFSEGFDFETAITSDVTLYAKWTRVFVVTFHNENGNAISSQTVEEGQTAAEPTEVTCDKSGDWRFEGWYTEEELLNVFDFDATLTSDTELWAGWSQWFTLKFIDTSGTYADIEDIEVKAGSSLRDVPELKRDGFEFWGWCSYGYSAELRFDNISNNMNCFARWDKKADRTSEGHQGLYTLNLNADCWVDRVGYLGFVQWLDVEFKYVDSNTVWSDPDGGTFLKNVFDPSLSYLFGEFASLWDGSGLLSDFITTKVSNVSQKYYDMTGWTKSDLNRAWSEIKEAQGLTLCWIDSAAPETVIYYFEKQLYLSENDAVLKSMPYAFGLEIVNVIKNWNRLTLLTIHLDGVYTAVHSYYPYWQALKTAQGILKIPDDGGETDGPVVSDYSKMSDWLKAKTLDKYGETSEQYWALINEILNPEFIGYVDCDTNPSGFVAWIENDSGWYSWSDSSLRESEFVEIRALLVQWANEFASATE